MAHKKIAVLGGTFNPVHYGHINLARNVAATPQVDEVWLSLSPLNPFKAGHDIPSARQRLEALEEALKDETNVRATDIELSLPLPSYMIDALDTLTVRHPDLDFTLLIGSDNLEGFTRWRRWQEILERYGLLVYPRHDPNTTLPAALQPYASRITLLADMPLYPVSSTQLRQSPTP